MSLYSDVAGTYISTLSPSPEGDIVTSSEPDFNLYFCLRVGDQVSNWYKI